MGGQSGSRQIGSAPSVPPRSAPTTEAAAPKLTGLAAISAPGTSTLHTARPLAAFSEGLATMVPTEANGRPPLTKSQSETLLKPENQVLTRTNSAPMLSKPTKKSSEREPIRTTLPKTRRAAISAMRSTEVRPVEPPMGLTLAAHSLKTYVGGYKGLSVSESLSKIMGYKTRESILDKPIATNHGSLAALDGADLFGKAGTIAQAVDVGLAGAGYIKDFASSLSALDGVAGLCVAGVGIGISAANLVIAIVDLNTATNQLNGLNSAMVITSTRDSALSEDQQQRLSQMGTHIESAITQTTHNIQAHKVSIAIESTTVVLGTGVLIAGTIGGSVLGGVGALAGPILLIGVVALSLGIKAGVKLFNTIKDIHMKRPEKAEAATKFFKTTTRDLIAKLNEPEFKPDKVDITFLKVLGELKLIKFNESMSPKDLLTSLSKIRDADVDKVFIK